MSRSLTKEAHDLCITTSVSGLKRAVVVGAHTLRVAGSMRCEGSANSARGERASTAVGERSTTAEPDEHTPEPHHHTPQPHTSVEAHSHTRHLNHTCHLNYTRNHVRFSTVAASDPPVKSASVFVFL